MTTVLDLKDNVFRLPSAGLAYDASKIELLDGHSVKVRKFLMGDQRELTGVLGSADAYQVYSTLLRRLIVEPKKIDIDELLMTDVFAILYGVKATSFGPEFTVEYTCPSCRADQQPLMSIFELAVMDAEEMENYKADGLEIEVSGHQLVCHLPRMKDERAVTKALSDMKRMGRAKNTEADRIYLRTAQLIDSIDGDTSLRINEKFEKLMEFDVGSGDTLGEFLNDKDTGIMLDKAIAICSSCSAENNIPLGFTPDFFRPAVRR